MMLKKMADRLKKRNARLVQDVQARDGLIKGYEVRCQRLMEKLRGNGAKASVPAELQECYTYAIEYVTRNRYRDKTSIGVFKNPGTIDLPAEQKRGATVIDWAVTRIDEGLYDVEFVREWVY